MLTSKQAILCNMVVFTKVSLIFKNWNRNISAGNWKKAVHLLKLKYGRHKHLPRSVTSWHDNL